MKLLTTIAFVFFTMTFSYAQLDVQELYDYANKKENLGKCFITTPLDTNNAEKYYLQIIPPVLEKYSVEVNEEFIEKYLSEEERKSSSSFSYEIRPAYIELIFVKKQNNCNLSLAEFENAKAFCVKYEEKDYKELKKIAIIENGDTSYTVSKQVIECERILAKEKVNVFKDKDLINPDYPVFEIIGGEWSEFKDYLCPTTRGVASEIILIQKKLIKEGYNVEVNGILNHETKNALLDFQEKHGLSHPLGLDTLKKLGIDMSKMTISKY